MGLLKIPESKNGSGSLAQVTLALVEVEVEVAVAVAGGFLPLGTVGCLVKLLLAFDFLALAVFFDLNELLSPFSSPSSGPFLSQN